MRRLAKGRLARTAAALLMFLPGISALADDCPEVVRALFAERIVEREPVNPLASVNEADGAVVFFIEIHEGAGETLLVDWFSSGVETITVSLPIGGDRWRTWSSRNLGQATEQDWRVRLRTRSGCDLGDHVLPWRAAPTEPSGMAALESALANADLSATRVALLDALDQQPEHPRLQRIRDIDVPLLQLEVDLREQRLYTGGARLAQLEERLAADDPARERLTLLANQLHQQQRALSLETQASLQALAASITASPMAALPCPSSAEDTHGYWELINPGLPLVATSERADRQSPLLLLDSRTGETHQLEIDCIELP